MEFLFEYGLFFAKIITAVIAVLVTVAGMIALSSKETQKCKGKLKIDKMNEQFNEYSDILRHATLSKKAYKKYHKTLKKSVKKSNENHHRQRLFVLDFTGDIKASTLSSLREEITALLTIATPEDEVLVRLESPGGMVHAYGLAASQLTRLREKNIPLTIAVDKVAASGGYMMAAVANRILAAPFSIIGSIGVVAQLPNFHRLMKKSNIDFEMVTAGEYKRTLTVFGENTAKAREKFREDLEDIHLLFKEFITQYRPTLDINKVATGEHWLATRAKELDLVDTITTSDDYLMAANQDRDIFHISYVIKKSLGDRLGRCAGKVMEVFFNKVQETSRENELI